MYIVAVVAMAVYASKPRESLTRRAKITACLVVERRGTRRLLKSTGARAVGN